MQQLLFIRKMGVKGRAVDHSLTTDICYGKLLKRTLFQQAGQCLHQQLAGLSLPQIKMLLIFVVHCDPPVIKWSYHITLFYICQDIIHLSFCFGSSESCLLSLLPALLVLSSRGPHKDHAAAQYLIGELGRHGPLPCSARAGPVGRGTSAA